VKQQTACREAREIAAGKHRARSKTEPRQGSRRPARGRGKQPLKHDHIADQGSELQAGCSDHPNRVDRSEFAEDVTRRVHPEQHPDGQDGEQSPSRGASKRWSEPVHSNKIAAGPPASLCATEELTETIGLSFLSGSLSIVGGVEDQPELARVLVSGSTANKATEAALLTYPGGVVDRVVQLSNGDYEVHNIGVTWPHHIFVNKDFKVIGAND
jgi:hypothetical protein